MYKMTAVALCAVFSASTALTVQAQQAAATDKPAQMQRHAEPTVHCTANSSGVGATQPCGIRAGEALRLGSDATRGQVDCVMSGVCGPADRGRVAS